MVRPLSQALAPLASALDQEADPLLRDTYRWLLGLARDNEAFRDGWLAPAATLRERLEVLDQHAASFVAKVVRERAAVEWSELAKRAHVQSWTGRLDADLPLLTAVVLLRQGRPDAAPEEAMKLLAEKLARGAPVFAARESVLQLAAARLRPAPTDALVELAPLALVVKGRLPAALGASSDVEQEVTRRLAAAFEAHLATARPAPGSASAAVYAWLGDVFVARASTTGPLAEPSAACLAKHGLRRSEPGPQTWTVRVVADPPKQVFVQERRARQVVETYYLTPDEQRMLEAGLRAELAELDRVEAFLRAEP